MHSCQVHVYEQILIDLLGFKDLPNLVHVILGTLHVILKSATCSENQPVLGKFDTFRVAHDTCD